MEAHGATRFGPSQDSAPHTEMISSRFIAVFLALAAGCAPPPLPPKIPEPASALRPESLRGAVPSDARIADYRLDARLDADEHTIDGTALLTWRNTTSRTVTTLPFHLYMNGFRAEDTAWMRSSRGRHRDSALEKEGTWGYIDISSVRLLDFSPAALAPDTAGPIVVSDAIEHPGSTAPTARELEWREHADPSTMTVTLPHPVGPGQAVTVELEFLTRLPKVVARTGYADDFHAVGQWYPKIGVLEDETGWQAHTFTYHDEFYADFGNYLVTLDLPEHMVVGASGVRVAEESLDSGRKRLTYSAEMVHDFAWFADPDFVEHHGEHHGVRIRQLMQPERLGDAEAHLGAQVAALDSYQARFGPYPWSTITIVHPPEGARGAGGMEYPTLFTTNDRKMIPEWLRASIFDERISGLLTTVHEFGHQYFQGMFAVREHLEPWLDEGMNTFSNYLAATDRLGDDAWVTRVFDRKLYISDFLRLTLRQKAFWEPIERPASAFDGVLGNYGATIYAKTAAVMVTLRNLVGAGDFDRALAVFSQQARFRHPRGEQLEAILVEQLGERVKLSAASRDAVFLDLRQYLDQALRTERQVDFAVLAIDNRRRLAAAGWRRGAGGQLEGGEPPANLDTEIYDLPDEQVEGIVAVRRAGDFVVPVELRVELADGGVETRVWDGREPTAIFTFPGRRVEVATLDPDGKLLLEWRRLDNSALAADLWQDDGVSGPFGDLAEGFSLALLGSLGP